MLRSDLHTSFELRRIASQSSKPRLKHTGNKPIAQSSGSTRSTRRLRIASSTKSATRAER